MPRPTGDHNGTVYPAVPSWLTENSPGVQPKFGALSTSPPGGGPTADLTSGTVLVELVVAVEASPRGLAPPSPPTHPVLITASEQVNAIAARQAFMGSPPSSRCVTLGHRQYCARRVERACTPKRWTRICRPTGTIL